MNAGRFLQLIQALLSVEEKHALQAKLVAFQTAFTSLVSTPQDTNVQTDLANKLSELEKGMDSSYSELSPVQISTLTEMDGIGFFGQSLLDAIRAQISANSLTPAVAKKQIDRLVARRQTFIEQLSSAMKNLVALKVKPSALSPGEAEIGFLIPREIFSGALGEFAKELHTLDKIVKLFAEAAHGHHDAVKINTISTSDPIIFLGLDVTVVALIGMSITWMLATYKQILSIKKLRKEASDLGFSDGELKVFEERITNAVDKSIDERVAAIMDDKVGGRNNELRNGLTWALRSLLARIERGMTVEINVLPPPESAEGEGQPADAQPFSDSATAARNLEFPRTEGPPVTALPPPHPPPSSSRRSKHESDVKKE